MPVRYSIVKDRILRNKPNPIYGQFGLFHKNCGADWTRDPGDQLTEISKRTHQNQVEKAENGMECNGWCLLTASFRLRLYIKNSAPASTFSLRKEVIQPQVLLRLPCYDFTPIMSHTLGRSSPFGSGRRLLVQPTFVM